MKARIRLHVGELRIHGATPLEAQRLRDALVAELERGPWAECALRSRFEPRVAGGRIRAARRLDASGAALAEVVRRAVQR